MRNSSRVAGSTEGQVFTEVLADTWDGPHFRLCYCGFDVFGQPPVRVPFVVAAESIGCWQYMLSGSIYYKVGTERYRVDAGEALITRRPDRGSTLSPVNDAPVKMLWLAVKEESALQMLNYLHMKYGAIQHFGMNSGVVRLARELVSLAAEEPRRPAHFWSEKTFQWMNAWWKYAEEHHVSWNCEALDVLKPSSLIAQTPQTVKGFASQMGYSRSYLTRKLTQQWQKSPGEVLRLVRLQKAASLLRTTQLSIGEIATQVGYGASAAFGRAFMQVYGQSPRAYRHDRD